MSHLPIKITLPEHFLEEEERCGYVVSSKMKSVWAVELDLLNEFRLVCEKYDIQWWMDGGSLLGAIRHNGYIPWDDDIDVMLFRKDYDRLCEIASKEFLNPYFFQTELTDHGSMRGHAQLRNSLTTGILKAEESAKYKFNQGIFIDIFPLDAIPDDKFAFEQQLSNLLELKQICYRKRKTIHELCNVKRKNLIMMVYDRIKGYLFNSCLYDKYGNKKNYLNFEEEARKYMNKHTQLVGNLILGTFKDNWAWHREDFDAMINVPFEFMQVPVPKGYERRLAEQYGDWKTPIMMDNLHGNVLFDVAHPYTKYI